MANPQKENGYTAIANEVMDALMRWRFSKYESSVVTCVLRKTYGYGKKDDWISLSQFVEATGIQKAHVCRALRMLLEQNIVTKGGTPAQPRYTFQKDYEKWKQLPEGSRTHSPGVTKRGTPDITNRGTKGLPKGAPETVTKRGNEGVPFGAIEGVPKGAHTKENITKVDITIAEETSANSKDVADIIDIFVKAGNKTLRFGNVTQRKACERLITDIGIQKALSRARYAASVQKDRYAPNITTPLELEQKMHKLETYYQREQGGGGGIAIIS